MNIVLKVCRMWSYLQNDKTFWNVVYTHYEHRLKRTYNQKDCMFRINAIPRSW